MVNPQQEAAVQTAKSLREPSYILALRDLGEALIDHNRWSRLALLGLKRGYWRTRLGLVWQPLSFLAFVVTISWLWSSVIGRDLSVYLPHLGYGLVCWVFISSMVGGGEQVFSANAGIIREFPLPLTFFAFSKMAGEMIVFSSCLGVMMVLDIIFIRELSAVSILALPAIALYAANGVFTALLIGMLTTRYRDVAQLVPTLMRGLFFITPVMWIVDGSNDRSTLALLNPFYHYIEIIRSPMRGSPADLIHWLVTMGCTLILFGLVLAFYKLGTRQLRIWL